MNYSNQQSVLLAVTFLSNSLHTVLAFIVCLSATRHSQCVHLRL